MLSAFLIFGSAGSALASEGTVTSAPVTSDTADNSLEDQTENGGVTGETGLEETEPETGDEQKETNPTTDQGETEKAESDETKDSSAEMTNSGDTVTEDPAAGEETGTELVRKPEREMNRISQRKSRFLSFPIVSMFRAAAGTTGQKTVESSVQPEKGKDWKRFS